MGAHLIDGEFQSDKYPTCPRGKVPLSTKDPTAQDLLWQYAQRRRSVDAQFADDLEWALRSHGYTPTPSLTPEQLADLRKKAEKASPRVWCHSSESLWASLTAYADGRGDEIATFRGASRPRVTDNAAFAAAANPATVLALLDEREELMRERDAAGFALGAWQHEDLAKAAESAITRIAELEEERRDHARTQAMRDATTPCFQCGWCGAYVANRDLSAPCPHCALAERTRERDAALADPVRPHDDDERSAIIVALKNVVRAGRGLMPTSVEKIAQRMLDRLDAARKEAGL